MSVFRLLSALLDYPDEDLVSAEGELFRESEDVRVASFIRELAGVSLRDLQD